LLAGLDFFVFSCGRAVFAFYLGGWFFHADVEPRTLSYSCSIT
jgi:hypothetical protein